MSGRTNGDLISRAAALEELESAKVYMTAHEDGVNIGNIFAQYNRGLSDGMDRLKQLPAAEPEPQWIPCSERLPEEKQDVLLLMPLNMVVGFWEDVLSDGGRTWYANSGNGYFTDMDVLYGYDDPIAWMELPKPYGGDEDEAD